MPYNGAGAFSPVYQFTNDAANGIKILASRQDTQWNDVATNGLSNCVTKDGQTTTTQPIPFAQGATFAGVSRFDTAGNLGVGVVPSAWDSANGYYGIQVAAGAAVWGASTLGAVFSSNVFHDGTDYTRISTGTTGLYGVSGNEHTWYGDVSGAGGATFTPTRRMRIDANGNFQLGNVTTAGNVGNPAQISAGLFSTAKESQNAPTGGTTTLVFAGLDPNATYLVSARGSGSNGEVNATFIVGGGGVNVIAGVTTLANYSFPGGDLTYTPQTYGNNTPFTFSPANSGKFQIAVANNTGGTVSVDLGIMRFQ